MSAIKICLDHLYARKFDLQRQKNEMEARLKQPYPASTSHADVDHAILSRMKEDWQENENAISYFIHNALQEID